jgi:hypothetical protein
MFGCVIDYSHLLNAMLETQSLIRGLQHGTE